MYLGKVRPLRIPPGLLPRLPAGSPQAPVKPLWGEGVPMTWSCVSGSARDERATPAEWARSIGGGDSAI